MIISGCKGKKTVCDLAMLNYEHGEEFYKKYSDAIKAAFLARPVIPIVFNSKQHVQDYENMRLMSVEKVTIGEQELSICGHVYNMSLDNDINSIVANVYLKNDYIQHYNKCISNWVAKIDDSTGEVSILFVEIF